MAALADQCKLHSASEQKLSMPIHSTLIDDFGQSLAAMFGWDLVIVLPDVKKFFKLSYCMFTLLQKQLRTNCMDTMRR